MLTSSPFYNESLRRYVIVFGTMFNNIRVNKKLQDDTVMKQVKVPIGYGPAEKFLVAAVDKNKDRPVQIELPRMSFEVTGMIYAADRKLPHHKRWTATDATESNEKKTVWQPVPYDINFQLNIIAKSYDEGSMILEQILPYFGPEYTNSVQLMDDLDLVLDVPLILIGVSNQDTYEGDYKERRQLIWTLDFVMKGFFFGPRVQKKLIKIANTNFYDALTSVQKLSTVRIRPGLTANGEPTTNEDESIPVADIGVDDDWDYIVTITDDV
jgi:hypothetical protein